MESQRARNGSAKVFRAAIQGQWPFMQSAGGVGWDSQGVSLQGFSRRSMHSERTRNRTAQSDGLESWRRAAWLALKMSLPPVRDMPACKGRRDGCGEGAA
eukprot:4290216-Prymnesium_polylepis.1